MSRGHGLRADHIAALRKKGNLTQAALAASIGIDRVTLARIESGNTDPHLSTVRALAQSLGVPIAEITDD